MAPRKTSSLSTSRGVQDRSSAKTRGQQVRLLRTQLKRAESLVPLQVGLQETKGGSISAKGTSNGKGSNKKGSSKKGSNKKGSNKKGTGRTGRVVKSTQAVIAENLEYLKCM